MEDEILDLVDTSDKVVGQMPRAEVKMRGLQNIRVINVLIVNDQGRLWIPRRTANKAAFPNALDMSVGGYVSSGETYGEAFRRETMEELNLDIATVQWRDLGMMNPHEHGTTAFMHVYEIQSNTAPSFNPDDFSEGYWLTPQEILDLVANSEYVKDDLPFVIRHFYGK